MLFPKQIGAGNCDSMQILINNIWNLTKTQIQISRISKHVIQPHRCYSSPASSAEETTRTGQTQPKEQKTIRVAVVGVPNVGKSTFINNLINHRVCPISSKVHTTRKANRAIYTTGQTQVILYDTPGLVTQQEMKRHKLEQSFSSAYRHAIQNTDMIAVLHDVSNTWTRKTLHSTVMDTLKAYPKKPSVLILNKIDILKSKRITLELIRVLTNNTLTARKKHMKREQLKQQQQQIEDLAHESSCEKPSGEFGELHKIEGSWSDFSHVFLVSSITGNGLKEVLDYFMSSAKPCDWKYPSGAFTDETPEDLIVNSVRARLLDYLPQEIPYTLKTSIEYYSVDNNTVFASVEVVCPTKRIERLICGESNGRLRQITERVTSDLVETFGKPISFTIATRPKIKSEDKA